MADDLYVQALGERLKATMKDLRDLGVPARHIATIHEAVHVLHSALPNASAAAPSDART